jgi:uncharacterized membrane-anchored protein YhcB (DUF1043 family)
MRHDSELTIGAIMLILGVAIGISIALLAVKRVAQQVAVDHECAHWDNRTAVFTWNNPTKP